MRRYRATILAIATLLVVGCSTNGASSGLPEAPEFANVAIRTGETAAHLYAQPRVWEEPMYDTIRVPASLDKTGTYFRPAHNTVVEIRRGKYQEVQFPGGR